MKRDEIFSYRSWPFYWLTRANGRYRARMETALRPLGLDMPTWRVLMTLHEDHVASVSEIADHSSTKLPTMTRIIQRMEADGFVRRRPRAGNDRIMEVMMTKTGKQASDDAYLTANALYRRAFSGLSDIEIAILNEMLRKVAENLNE